MNQHVMTRNNVNVSGKGTQPMLLAHGFGCDQHMWQYITPAFEDDYRLILFDYVGSGGSDLNSYSLERYSSLNGYAQDVLDICEALDLRNIIFVGHSVSSMIGALAAIQQPDRFERLIMIGPSPRYINDTGYIGGFERADIEELLTLMDHNYIGWAHTLAPAIMGNPDRPALGQELTDGFCSTDPIIARQFARITFLSDNRTDLSALQVNSLIMQCDDDLIAPVSVGEYTHQQLANSSIRYLKATGHCPHVSAPAETIAIMKEYLQEAQPA
ncbi:sigma factor SigB/phosphatase RsbP regulator RsbQ [Spirosoma knui]